MKNITLILTILLFRSSCNGFALHCSALQCFAPLCFALLCFAMLCFALRCLALICIPMLCFANNCFAVYGLWPLALNAKEANNLFALIEVLKLLEHDWSGMVFSNIFKDCHRQQVWFLSIFRGSPDHFAFALHFQFWWRRGSVHVFPLLGSS